MSKRLFINFNMPNCHKTIFGTDCADKEGVHNSALLRIFAHLLKYDNRFARLKYQKK